MAISPRYCLKRPNLSDEKDLVREDLESAIDNELQKRWQPGDKIEVKLDASRLTAEEAKEIFDYFCLKYALYSWQGVTYFGLRDGNFTRDDHSITFSLVFPCPS